jgi:hypothetical protein
MQFEYSTLLPVLIVAIICARLGVAAFVRSAKRKGSGDRATLHSVRFDINEIPRIRGVLGNVAAEALMQKLADRLESELQPNQRPLVGPTSISCSIAAVDQDEASLMLQRAMAALACKATVSGIDFYCSANASIMPGLASVSASLDEPLNRHAAEQRWDARLDLLRALPDALATGQISMDISQSGS